MTDLAGWLGSLSSGDLFRSGCSFVTAKPAFTGCTSKVRRETHRPNDSRACVCPDKPPAVLLLEKWMHIRVSLCGFLCVKVNATEEEVEEWQERFCEDEDDEEQEGGGGVRGGGSVHHVPYVPPQGYLCPPSLRYQEATTKLTLTTDHG